MPLKIIIINNDGGGIFTLLPIHKEKSVLDYITSPHGQNFKKIAQSFNIDYIEAHNRDEFNGAFNSLQLKKQHTILEVFIDHETNKSVYDQLRTIKY